MNQKYDILNHNLHEIIQVTPLMVSAVKTIMFAVINLSIKITIF